MPSQISIGHSVGLVFFVCLAVVSSTRLQDAQEEVLLLQMGVSMERLQPSWLQSDSVKESLSKVVLSKTSNGVQIASATVAVAALALGIGLVAMAATRKDTPQEVAKEAAKDGKESQGGSEPNASAGAGPGTTYSEAMLPTVIFFVVGHALSASTLTVVNKWAMNEFHPPGVPAGDHHHGYVWLLSLIQFVVSAIVAKLVGLSGVAKCDPLQWKQALNYFPAAGMFMISIVAGNAVMNYSSVSSFLIMRAAVPVPCAILETLVYRDPLPPAVSWLCLAVMVAGTVMYGVSLGGLEVEAVGWVVIFMVCMPVDGLLIKHAISASSLSSWGLVYYNNVLASIPLVFYVALFEVQSVHAFKEMISALMVPAASLAVGVSCVVGVSISFFQMTTRYYISATAFMVLGVVNKFLTVLWNEIFMEQDSRYGLIGILLTLGGAVAWQLSMSYVGSGSVKLRPKAESSQSATILAFGATVAGLAAAAYVQHITSR
eukprot:gb/GFBE01012464.1/.p1 GENE.gb/GFBE01012464.1/~~gb/GFBE01012464.1/.p1  ORF type:complete len:487 (+),score=103.87 gb/GFBE01012464.1/:1-1461(+)